ncbi:MAG: T9SS type A sorting domain-containing protein [Bacteroidales bacterium]|nr:T9SS type A sorting domain-containing protein [Bacteroidales bacterium]
MRKLVLLATALFTITFLQAQWVNNPSANTFIANCENSAAEIRVATSPDGGTFVQWTSMSDNGWSPKLQYLDAAGVPQWSNDGVHITTPNLATWSPGYALAALSDGSVVSMFRSAEAKHWVVKINADGSTPWGTDGMLLFNGEGGGRSELLAGDDGGFWALGTDMDISYLQYVDADGTLRSMTTIADLTKKCTNGKLVPADNGVFVVYAKQTLQGYTNYNKEIYVAGYNKDGERIYPETLLLGQQTVGMSYIHYAISDGMGGAYVFQYHNGIGGVYNVYVTHFNENGAATIFEPNGVTVHQPDQNSFFITAYPTVDPISHDLLLVYRQTDSYSQSQYKIWINRITATGEKPWDDGILVLDNGTTQCGGLRIDAFEYGEGFSVIYHKAVSGAYQETIEATGFDMDGNVVWNTQMCRSTYPKTGDENTSGFHNGQNIVAWVNAQDGGLYGQNIGWDGTMGEITPPTPPAPCNPPTNFNGEYIYTETMFGVTVSWDAPETTPLHYNLYRTDRKEVIEIDPEFNSYFDELEPGDYMYKLTAVYEDCESEYALTQTGDDYLFITVTSASENTSEENVTITGIYTMSGQRLKTNDSKVLKSGVYIIQGVTADGKPITRRLIVN